MKIQSFKTGSVLLSVFLTAPFIGEAQEFPPENAFNTPMDCWLLVVVGVGALYGVIKMWSRSRQVK